jgi:hypothetical protein
VEEADGRGEPGRRDGDAGGGAAVGRKGRPEVGDDPDRWAPPVGGCVREREGRRVGRVGRRRNGPVGLNGRANLVGRRKGWWVGPQVGLVCFFLFFFLFFFKSIFKPISNLLKFKSFTSFQIQILTQISPTNLRTFHKPFLTTFQTYFKFKPSFFFNSTFTQIFLQTFHNYF